MDMVSAEPARPPERTSMVEGPSKTEGSVVRRQREARKALAFLERWLKAGGAIREPRPEQGRAVAKDCRWVDPAGKKMTQVRGKERNVETRGRPTEGGGVEGGEAAQESARDRVRNVITTVASDSNNSEPDPQEQAGTHGK